MEDNGIKRIQPHSIEAEQTVIGAMILNNQVIPEVEGIITGEDFYQKQFGIVFDTMVELYDEGSPVDLVTLGDRLKEKDVSPEISSVEYIGSIAASVPYSSNAKYYAQIVYEKSMLRQLIRVSTEIQNDCFADKDKLENIMETTEQKVFHVLNRQRASDYVPISQVVLNVLDRIHQASKTKNPVTGIPTGFIDLDRQLTGLQKSDLVLIAARPSMGKTAFALNIAEYASLRKNFCTAIFSLEMSKEQLVNRLLAMESRVDAQNIRTGNLSENDWDNLLEGMQTLASSKIIIDDTPGITVGEMRSKCRKYKLEKGLDLVLIDYIQLMTGAGRSESRQQEVSEISRSLKALARELEVPVVALSQLSRAVESRTDHRPMLSDLRESGAIEQDADVVMFLYRDDYYHKDSEKKDICEIIVAKQRNGPIGTVELAWLPQYTKFMNLERR